MSCTNCYDCLPLVLTPIGATGATGPTGATGATGASGFSIVGYTGLVSTTGSGSWEDLATYTLNVDSTTGQLLQNGEGYYILYNMATNATGLNTRQFRILIGATASTTIYGTFYPIVNQDSCIGQLTVTRLSSTVVTLAGTSSSYRSNTTVVSTDNITVSDLASNSFVLKIQGFTTSAPSTVSHINSVVNFMNKA